MQFNYFELSEMTDAHYDVLNSFPDAEFPSQIIFQDSLFCFYTFFNLHMERYICICLSEIY